MKSLTRGVRLALLPFLLAVNTRAQAPTPAPLAPGGSPQSLAQVRRAVGNARVVLLSAPGYGAGGAFAANLRLIRMLHEQLGFDVLAFESGQLDMERVEAALGDAKIPLRTAALRGLLPFYALSPQVDSTLAYVRATRGTARPLRVAGFDPQGADRLASAAEIVRALAAAGIDERTLYRFSEMNGYLYRGPGANSLAAAAALRSELQQLQRVVPLHRDTLAKHEGADRAALLERALTDMMISLDLLEANRSNPIGPASLQNPREQRMADNLTWLARERFPQRKIMVWLNARHALYEPALLEDSSGATPYPDLHTAAAALRQQLGAGQVYSLGITAVGGEHGLVYDRKPKRLRSPSKGSLEAACARVAPRDAFFDLRGSKARFSARALELTDLTGAWARQLDGVLCLQRMTPAAPRAGSIEQR